MKAAIKPVVFLICLIPALYYFYAVYLAFSGGGNLLGPDPAQALQLATGNWAVRFLIASLAVTPLRYLLNWPYLLRLRRMIGLYAFFYASLHLLVFLMFLLGWQWQDIGTELAERPYITVGFSAWLLMVPLALTSFNKAQRKLGRRWKKLHRLAYGVGILAVIHIVWLIRSSYFLAFLYGSLVFLLLGYRLLRRYVPAVRRFTLFPPKKRRRASAAGASPKTGQGQRT